MDSFWTTYSDYIIGIPAIILTIVATWISWKQLQKKRFVYKILSQDRQIYYKKRYRKEIEEHLNKNNLRDASLVFLKFENTGNSSIHKSDFENSIKIIFKNTTQILFAEAIEKEPKEIDIKFFLKKNELEVLSFLFNPKDKFYVKILINSTYESPRISSRVVGLNIKEKKDKWFLASREIFNTSIFFMFVVFMISFIIFNNVNFGYSDVFGIFFNLLKYLSLIISILSGLILFDIAVAYFKALKF